MATFLEYLESNLGTMAGGCRFDAPAGQEVSVARFENQPVAGAITYVTTGLSRHLLHQLEGPDLRIELIACTWNRFRAAKLESNLFILAQNILASHHAPPHGAVQGPAGPVAPGSTLEAFYFMHPAYHPEAMEEYPHPSESIVMAWPVPISASEAAYVRNAGWRAFEEQLFNVDPDLMDLQRLSFV